MKQLTAEELFELKHGDKVYRWNGRDFRGLRYVGRMPGSQYSLIFSDGTYLTHLYIDVRSNTFHGKWYGGEYDSKIVGNLKIQLLEKAIESIKGIYLKD